MADYKAVEGVVEAHIYIPGEEDGTDGTGPYMLNNGRKNYITAGDYIVVTTTKTPLNPTDFAVNYEAA